MKLITGIGSILLLFSCTPQEVCEENAGSDMVARLKSHMEGIPADTVVSGISLYGIRAGKADSLIYDSVTASRLVLPLNPAEPQSLFVLSTAGGTDTLAIMHRNSFYLVSYSCGFGTRFTLTEVDHSGSLIKGLQVVNTEVDAELEADEEHIWIYF